MVQGCKEVDRRMGRRKKMKIMKAAIVVFLILCILVVAAIGILRAINARKSRIETANGIQENTYVEIGGIKQYLQIRGENQDNPIILWLHGGPGFPLTYLNYYYQRDLEKDYTIVCWEQRGCGRTYYANEKNGNLSARQLFSDMDELVDYLRERFGQEKLIIIGQSWGTVLGAEYSNRFPEKVAAYIGVGQVVDFSEGKIYAAENALQKSVKNGNSEDAELLNRLISQFKTADSVDDINIDALEKMILKSMEYLKSDGELSGISQMFIAVTSPEMSWNDARWFLYASNTGNIFVSQNKLIEYMYFQFDAKELKKEYAIPVCFIQGADDWITPTGLVEEYYNSISSEDKELIIIKDAGHTPFLDHPDQFCNAVKQFLNQ